MSRHHQNGSAIQTYKQRAFRLQAPAASSQIDVSNNAQISTFSPYVRLTALYANVLITIADWGVETATLTLIRCLFLSLFCYFGSTSQAIIMFLDL